MTRFQWVRMVAAVTALAVLALAAAAAGAIDPEECISWGCDGAEHSTFNVRDGRVGEGGVLTVTVTLTPPVTRTHWVDVGTSSGSAWDPADYTGTAGTLAFEPGDMAKTFTVQTRQDDLREPSEVFWVTLLRSSGPRLGNAAPQSIDDDGDTVPPSLSIADARVTEGDFAVFRVSLNTSSSEDVEASYSTSPGTASESDFRPASGRVGVPAGWASWDLHVATTQDGLDEEDETFSVRLADVRSAQLGRATAWAVIADDDAGPTVSIEDGRAVEGERVYFRVALDEPSEHQVSVEVTTAHTTTGDDDLRGAYGHVLLPAGDTERIFWIQTLDDDEVEGDETFRVRISNPQHASLGWAEATGLIVDDDTWPKLSVADTSVREGATASITVTLDGPATETVTAALSTVDGTATAGADHPGIPAAEPRIVTFSPGDTVESVQVATTQDSIDEQTEHFEVVLAEPTKATIADGRGVVAVEDDEGDATLTVGDTAVREGDAGTTDAVFVVRLLPASDREVTARVATAQGTATSPADFAATIVTVRFAPGTTEQAVRVAVVGDRLVEGDERFSVELSDVSGAVAGDAVAAGTITDDDVATVSAGDVRVVETDSGTTPASVPVLLSRPSARPVTVRYRTVAGSAAAGADFESRSGTLTFAAHETSGEIAVPVLGDRTDEEDETFDVVLADPVGAQLADATGTVTVADDDAPPAVHVDDVTLPEGGDATSAATFTVRLGAASGRTVTVGYATADGTATAGPDYDRTAGTLTFTPGDTVEHVHVVVRGDTVHEPDEHFSLRLAGPTDATLADDRGVATILDDDPLPTTTKPTTTTTTTAPAPTTTPDADAGTTTTRPDAGTSGPSAPKDERDARSGYRLVASDGGIFAFGNAGFYGSTGSLALAEPIVAMAMTPTGRGYWLVARDGGVFAFGDAHFLGSTGGTKLADPVVGMAATPTGRGYWLVARDGGIFAYGDAGFFGSTAAVRLASPIVAIAATPTGRGYWLVAADGGIFAFGDAPFSGSTGGMRLAQPIVGFLPTRSGRGYWLVARDGGIFAFGDATFHGSTGAIRLNQPIVTAVLTPGGRGYWLVAADGGIFAFGDATFHGSTGAVRLNRPIVGASPA